MNDISESSSRKTHLRRLDTIINVPNHHESSSQTSSGSTECTHSVTVSYMIGVSDAVVCKCYGFRLRVHCCVIGVYSAWTVLDR